MATNESGIVSATKLELFALWLFDDDIFRLFPFPEWLYWCEMVGVKVYG